MGQQLSKDVMRTRCRKLGVWPDFVALRDEYKSGGMRPIEAWYRAFAELSGASGSLPDGKVEALGEFSIGKLSDMTGKSPVQSSCVSLPESPSGPGEPVPPSARGLPGPLSFSVALSDFAGKTPASAREVVQWVFDHMDISDVSVGSCPSSGAWSLLSACRSSKDLKREFYRQIWPKLLPTKSHLEMEARYRDDGRQLEIIDRVSAAAREADGLSGDSRFAVLSSRS